ncbi:hypothetical protein [Streptomyces zingiberis]|uniref:Uncharacterized protein n=1 Tax=Streptomyces zingiberis TaxID=2053010 RepID=A0ABX1BNE6_9ACTN|nr:hypothetical protein [Streptomyces zingiberis]NJP99248.1 hypothetical protein [Streptomyces zingiberis]
MRQVGRARAGLTAVAALAAAVTAVAWAPPATADGAAEPSPYRMSDSAEPVTGGATEAAAPELTARRMYTDTIAAAETLHYRVRLDATVNAHLSAVAALEPASRPAFGDGIEVTLRSADGARCDGMRSTAGQGGFGRPVAAAASRLVRPDASCQGAGSYLLTVERVGGATPGEWPLELAFMTEPGARDAATAPEGSVEWPDDPPAATGGIPRRTRGGTGFNDARPVGGGMWQDRVEPGQTLFYRIPVDWGQRLGVSVETAGTVPGDGADAYLGGGLELRLFNTARAPVHDESAAVDGRPKELRFATAPALFSHRFSSVAKVEEMRFAGWYHVAVGLTSEAAEGADFRLRLAVEGEAGEGPDYTGDAAAAGFAVTDADRKAAAEGGPAAVRPTESRAAGGAGEPDAPGSGPRQVIGFAGLGAGTALLFGLGLWTLAARRRAAGAPADAGASGPYPVPGPAPEPGGHSGDTPPPVAPGRHRRRSGR